MNIIYLLIAATDVLLIVFDVTGKIKIPFKKFIWILTLVVAIFAFIEHQQNNSSEIDSTVKSTETTDEPSTDAEIESLKNNSAVNSTETVKEGKTEADNEIVEGESQRAENFSVESLEETMNSNSVTGILNVASIADNQYTVDTIENVHVEIQPNEILTYKGNISYEEQCDEYSYTSMVSGRYRFEFSDVPNGTDLSLEIYNSGWEKIESIYDCDNGDGLTISLAQGETCYVRVKQYRSTGNYTLNIGQKKNIVDVTACTAVADSIQYTDQENDYFFVAENSGVHRFEFSGVPDGTDLQMGIYNSGWEKLETIFDSDNGDGVTISLESGESYYIRVKQYKGLGNYTLNIGKKKDIVEIGNYTAIYDSIQYTDQRNDYMYTPNNDGTHRLEFSNVANGTDLQINIYNSGWEEIDAAYDCDNEDGLTVSLKAGETYYISVRQYDNIGNYTLNIGAKKNTVGITAYSGISDSIQYADQENDYLIIADTDRDYKFTISGIQDGMKVNMEVLNSGWEYITSSYALADGDELEVSLTKGESYYIRIFQHTGIGAYTMVVE